ncbi:MAG: pyridoxamine 5'-phosphate oxidase [Panacagrimonas sp.]
MNHESATRQLLERDALPNPRSQLLAWLEDARAANMIEPSAMNLATIDADGRPDARIVLFKGFVDEGLSFFTNYDSRKGQQLASHGHAAVVFWWDQLERQVRVQGTVNPLARERSIEYFGKRPRISQLSAAISRQSQTVSGRQALETRRDALDRELGEKPVPCPPNWGGYQLMPTRYEFWQGRAGRLHDRLLYLPGDGGWTISRLEP